MRKQYHILNGDSLKEQFPENLQGEIIVARECLVDGSVQGNGLADFFKTRAQFICNNYAGYHEQDYYEKTVPEFEKMQNIPDQADVNLWFEDDLFCQVNLWFVLNLLHKSQQNKHIFLVRPKNHSPYSFGRLSTAELISSYENRLPLSDLDNLASLWEHYKNSDTQKLIETASRLKSTYPFIFKAVQAHIARIPNNENLGRPKEALIRIMDELKTDAFEPVFKAFCKREAIYGFGDLQVKRLVEQIIAER